MRALFKRGFRVAIAFKPIDPQHVIRGLRERAEGGSTFDRVAATVNIAEGKAEGSRSSVFFQPRVKKLEGIDPFGEGSGRFIDDGEKKANALFRYLSFAEGVAEQFGHEDELLRASAANGDGFGLRLGNP